MDIYNSAKPTLLQLSATIEQLKNEDYTRPSLLLNNSSIGNHTRHVIELFQCLLHGYKSGFVNYDNRKRDIKIETEKLFAQTQIAEIIAQLNLPNKNMVLEGKFCETNNEIISVETNFFREILYNIEHSIHHMALIRIGVTEISNITLPENFGVAASTIQHKKLCAQ